MNGFFGRIVISLAKFCVANSLVHYHRSHNLKKSLTFIYIVGHWYLASKIFFHVISIAKCPPNVPSCNSFITFWTFVVDRHLFNLLSYPIMYKTSFFIINGSTLLVNCCFFSIDKYSFSYLVYETFWQGSNRLRNTKIMSRYHLFCTPLHSHIWPCKNTKWMKLMESKVVVV